MSAEKEIQVKLDGQGEDGAQDPVLETALRNFRQSVHAWSDAEFNRPRTIAVSSSRSVARPWALVSCAMGLVMAAGLAGSGVYEHHRQAELARQEQARVAAEQKAEQQREMAAKRANEAEELLANVNRDISREVPSALEPLAQLMDDSQ